jgi:hypothetical protein
MLDALAYVHAEPNIGGWRRINLLERNALLFALTGQGMKMRSAPPSFLNIINDHPLVRGGIAFAYANKALNTRLLGLMVDIYDIRRFVDPARPQSPAKLKTFFRVAGPQTIFGIVEALHSNRPLNENETRVEAAWSAWAEQGYSTMPQAEIMATPQAFIYREYHEQRAEYEKTLNRSEATLMASWRTTTRFLSFIKELWQAKIEGVAFKADKFFKRQDEADEFNRYIKDIDNILDSSKDPT